MQRLLSKSFRQMHAKCVSTWAQEAFCFLARGFSDKVRAFVILKRKLREVWAAGKWGAGFAVLLGMLALLVRTPDGNFLERWSYDLPHLFRPQVEITNVAIIYMDDQSHAFLQAHYDGPWDRSLHARLLNILTASGAKAIAFDVLFETAGTDAAANLALADAIRGHGRVVLSANLGSGDYYGHSAEIRIILPYTNFLAATPYWGFAQLALDKDDGVRQHFHGWKNVPSLSWSLAQLLGAACTQATNGQRLQRWLNYYGPRDTLPHVSFFQVLEDPDGTLKNFFRDRIVFIGSSTESGPSGKRRDRFHSPYWNEPLWPGIDFHAIQFLNLIRGDWLHRMGPFAESGLLLVCGAFSGFGLALLRPRTATITAVAAATGLTAFACLLVWQTNTWFAWLVPAAVQIPVGLLCSLVRKAEHATIVRPTDLTTDFTGSGTRTAVMVADYEMLRRIGSGSYGEVWLARSATGTFRAVKVVDRKSAEDPRFQREFAGLKKFEPISRAHEGLVHILHVGRKEGAGQLYYVMELADSCASVKGEDAEGYVPTTLKTKLQGRGSLDPDELVRLSLALTSALAFLHEQGLLHRDIKPSNIIFVQGRPKLADIGLVAAADETHSFVGTEGYIPPEGPGTAAADVYGLGKVLSELLAETYHGSTADKKMRILRQFVEQACARSLSERPRNGQEMLKCLGAALES